MRVLSKTTKILFALILGLEAWGFWVRIMDGSYLMGGGGCSVRDMLTTAML